MPMTAGQSVCPFCNGILPVLAAPPSTEKVPCPRCGEPVPAARWQVNLAGIREGPPLAPVPSASTAARAPNIRTTALIVLGIMVTMASIGLWYALWTKELRQSRHPKMIIPFRRPLDLTGLGYLPKRCQIIAAWQVGAMVDDPTDENAKQLLAEPHPVVLDWIAKQIKRTARLELADIDHIVTAIAVGSQVQELVCVVRTRAKYSTDKIPDTIQATKSSHQGQPLYELDFHPMVEAMLWCVEDRTLVYLIRPISETPRLEYLQTLSLTPRPVEEVLPATARPLPVVSASTVGLMSSPLGQGSLVAASPLFPRRTSLHDVIVERLPRHAHTYLWAVGQVEQFTPLLRMMPLGIDGQGDLGPLKEMRTFALSLTPGNEMTLTGDFQMPDAKATARCKAFLDGVKLEKAQSQRVEIPPPTINDPAAQWVTWRIRTDVAGMRELLNLGKEVKK